MLYIVPIHVLRQVHLHAVLAIWWLLLSGCVRAVIAVASWCLLWFEVLHIYTKVGRCCMHERSPGQLPVHSLHGPDAVSRRTWAPFQTGLHVQCARLSSCCDMVLSALLTQKTMIDDTCCQFVLAVHDMLAAHSAHTSQSTVAS